MSVCNIYIYMCICVCGSVWCVGVCVLPVTSILQNIFIYMYEVIRMHLNMYICVCVCMCFKFLNLLTLH